MLEQKEFLSEFSLPTYEEWKEAAIVALKGVPFEKKMITSTYEDVDLQPIYNIADREKVRYVADSLPGKFPFTRGIDIVGYKGQPWYVAQSINYPLPSDFNKALLEDLQCGQDAVSIQICNCQTMFADMCNDAECKSEICRSVHISDMQDMEEAFKGIDITAIAIHFLPTCPITHTFEVATLFIAYCKKHNIDLSKVKVNFGFDFLTSIAKAGEFEKTSPKIALDEMAALIESLKKHNAVGTNVISIDTAMYHNAGASATQEIAYAVATGVYYIKELLNRGLDINDIAKNIHFNFASGVKFFIEIAKLRAARVVWAKIIKEFGGSEEAQKMTIHAFTSKVYNTKFDPHVNILRATTEGMSAILAGANSLNISPFDAKLGLPSDFSRRVARNIQAILKDESHIIDTIDPAGGSYYVETLTDEFVVKAWEIFRNIEKEGGIVAELEKGKIQNDIASVVEKRNKNIAFRKDVLLGTNKYPNLIEKEVDTILPYDAKAVQKHVEEGLNRKKIASAKAIYETLKTDKNAAATLAVEAFMNGANIADVWAAKEQKNNNIKAIPCFRAAKLFEDLRDAANEYKNKTGKAPSLFFANFGTLKQYKARADFSTDFFAVAGFNIIQGEGYMNAEEGIKAIPNITTSAVVICSTDDIYPEVVPNYVAELKKQKPNMKVILAGLPKDFVEAFKEAGVDEFIHIKSNVYETLYNLLKDIGVL